MSHYKPYPAYKDSGIKWLGNVPEQWEIKPIKSLANTPGTCFIDGDWIESKNLSDNGIRYITTGNVGPGVYKEQGSGYISEETFDELKCVDVRHGDVLLSRLNSPIGRACIVPDLGGRVVTSVDNVIFRPSHEYIAKYVVYRFSATDYFHEMGLLASGATMQRISRTELGNVRIAWPSKKEQLAIVEHLDRETARIDALVEKKTRFIELLREKRQALITHAVTKGLDPKVKMKDSGVEWLGEVPEHWQIRPLRHISRFSGGGTPSRDNPDYWNGSIPWVSPKDMKFEFIHGSEEGITVAGLENSTSTLVPEGRVLLVVRSGILKHTIPVAINRVPVALNQDMKAVWLDKNYMEASYFMRFVQAFNDDLLSAWLKQGATVESIEQDYLANTVIAVPPIEEQQQISIEINKENARIDALVSKTGRSIELLKERRSALITAAVTGQIDLREAA